MMGRIRSGLTYSNTIATLALVLALGGTSYAAFSLPAGSVGTKQLKTGAVTGKKVKRGSLLASNFKSGQLPRGATGPIGPIGPQGNPGVPGPASGAAGGALRGDYPNPALAPGAVTSSALAAGAVGAAQMGTVPAVLVDAPFIGPGQTISNGTFGTTIQWGNVLFDTAGMFSPAQNTRLTAPITGIYRVTCNMVLNDPTAAANFAALDISTVGGTALSEVDAPPFHTNYRVSFSASALVKLTKGDGVKAVVSQDSTGNWSVDNNSYTNFSLDWVSPAS